MNKKFILFLLIFCIVLLQGSTSFAHGIICEKERVGENTLRVMLKWDEPDKGKGINITSFAIKQGNFLEIGYEITDNKQTGIYQKDFDLRMMIYPVGIRLYNINNYDDPRFEDMKNHYAKEYTQHLHDEGIINGRGDGLFHPYDNLTRAEFMVFMTRALKLKTFGSKKISFGDIKGHWAENIINLAASHGLISGYGDGSVRPDNSVTVAEASTIISRAFVFRTKIGGIYEKIKYGMWYTDYVKTLFEAGILKKSDEIYKGFDAEKPLNRADCAMIVSRAMTTY